MGSEDQLADIISQIVQTLQEPPDKLAFGANIANNLNTSIASKKQEENFTPDAGQRLSAMNPEDQMTGNSRKAEHCQTMVGQQ